MIFPLALRVFHLDILGRRRRPLRTPDLIQIVVIIGPLFFCGTPMSDCKVEEQSRWRQLRQRDKETKKRTPQDVLWDYIHSGGATTLSFIVGPNTVISFVMRSIICWNMLVPLDNTALAYDSLRMFTSHFIFFFWT